MERETPAALQAFEDYWALGDKRSIPKLLELYREKKGNGEAVPTKRRSCLAAWSTDFHWQDRVKARVSEEAEAIRLALRQRTVKFRASLMDGIETDLRLYLKDIMKGKAILAKDASSLTAMAKLYFQLADEPLTDRQEVSGPGGAPLQIVIAAFEEEKSGNGGTDRNPGEQPTEAVS